ncbi:MAG: hypothetical protein BWY76_01051 [bacterium ADurb.Bin429]|nr:MAG: hypothetical protein BWY76_01051 [bacterium ADurb.Bin429]
MRQWRPEFVAQRAQIAFHRAFIHPALLRQNAQRRKAPFRNDAVNLEDAYQRRTGGGHPRFLHLLTHGLGVTKVMPSVSGMPSGCANRMLKRQDSQPCASLTSTEFSPCFKVISVRSWSR